MIQKCTRCYKELGDLRVDVALSTTVIRKREDETYEDIENSRIETHETLCLDCFNLFVETLEKGMEKQDV